MKVNLYRIEVEELVKILERRVNRLGRKIHRFINPSCRLCKNEDIVIRKLKDALKGDSE